MPERVIELSEDKREVVDIAHERTDPHHIIEEMMILANVAAAEALGCRTVGRVPRPRPSRPIKLEHLANLLEGTLASLARGVRRRPASSMECSSGSRARTTRP